ncbi:hypothetical protein K491DRAFT_319624 [Lophiostoma macrostomum CBS 122681]|uniref:Uncharacterized protein n=1 Tax=Lophiostoma macrostomum CBS 122681 TaxID=1314788 RepID=A0A6A6TCU2_9PLEO|nr:hypothetical protein K491DRAFT_319624 [Lophiostoma macrostomum CBS 122681]
MGIVGRTRPGIVRGKCGVKDRRTVFRLLHAKPDSWVLLRFWRRRCGNLSDARRRKQRSSKAAERRVFEAAESADQHSTSGNANSTRTGRSERPGALETRKIAQRRVSGDKERRFKLIGQEGISGPKSDRRMAPMWRDVGPGGLFPRLPSRQSCHCSSHKRGDLFSLSITIHPVRARLISKSTSTSTTSGLEPTLDVSNPRASCPSRSQSPGFRYKPHVLQGCSLTTLALRSCRVVSLLIYPCIYPPHSDDSLVFQKAAVASSPPDLSFLSADGRVTRKQVHAWCAAASAETLTSIAKP